MLDNVDDDLTALAIRAGLEEYGQYHETIAPGDTERVDQLRRVSRAVADGLGIEVGFAAVPTQQRGGDGSLRACAILVDSPAVPEHV